MSSCPVCGQTMLKFENPKREICPKEGSHPSKAGRHAIGGGKTGKRYPGSGSGRKKKDKK